MDLKIIFRYLVSFSFFVSMIFMTPVSFAQETGYAGSTLETTYHDKVNGDYAFTYGDSEYSGELTYGSDYDVVFDTKLPESSKIKLSRLYLYWTWSHEGSVGIYPEIEAIFEDENLMSDKEYTDRKGSGSYDYPSGTYAYDVTDLITDDTGDLTVRNIGLNKLFAINGACLLLIYEDPNNKVIEYWINEGCDIISVTEEVSSEEAVTSAYLDGDITTSNVKSAQLLTVVPGGNKGKNSLHINSKSWEEVYNGVPNADLAIDSRDVKDYLLPSDNVVRITDDGDYLTPSNVFLILESGDSSSDQPSDLKKTPGFEVIHSLVTFSIVICLIKYRTRTKGG